MDTATSGLILRSDAGPGGFGIDHNEYYFGIYPGQNKWKLWKVNAGVFSPVTNGTQTFNLNQYYTLSVNAASNVLMLYIDGSLKYTYTDTSSSPNPFNSYNAIGLRTRDAVTYFDDVRVDSQATAPTSYYRYNPANGALMHELDASGNIKISYTTDPKGNPVSVTRYYSGNASTFFYHYNAHGDVIAITDSNGNVVAKFSYDSWGVPTELSSTGDEQAIGTWTIPTGGSAGQGLFFLFGGMLYDAAAGLYLTKTRAYNPKTGRFLQRDILDESAKDGYDGFPFGKDAIGTNLYAWCNNNPVTREDPSGLWSFAGLGAKIGSYFGSAGARIGASIGSRVDYGIGYATGWGGGGGYNRYGYSGGGYGFSGNTAGRKAKQAVKAAAPVAPPEPAWKRAGPKSATSGLFSMITTKVPAAITQQLTRRDFVRPDYFSGINAAVGAVHDHYTSNEKSNDLENAAYDFGSMFFPPIAAGSVSNSLNDRSNGYISTDRFAWNLGMTAGAALTPAPVRYYFGTVPVFADVMDYGHNSGWLDRINNFMRTD